MKNNKQDLLQKVYEQYLLRGYDGVSISVLQEELQIGRSLLYYYFEDKETLYMAVLDRYFLHFMDQVHQIAPTTTAAELIERRTELIRMIQAEIKQFNNPNIHLSNLGDLLIHAYTHIKPFQKEIVQLKKVQLEQWKTALRNSIKKEEIRPDADVDVLADLFTDIKTGYESSIESDSEDAAAHYRNSCLYLLNLLKYGTQKD